MFKASLLTLRIKQQDYISIPNRYPMASVLKYSNEIQFKKPGQKMLANSINISRPYSITKTINQIFSAYSTDTIIKNLHV